MTDPIYSIIERLALIEGRITPTEPAGSQNPQQKSVHQLPALFKPGKGGPILGGDPNKPAVTKGYFVGAESEEMEKDIKQDKAIVKKAFAMHDKQEHEGEKTDLSKLRKGGRMKKDEIGRAHV